MWPFNKSKENGTTVYSGLQGKKYFSPEPMTGTVNLWRSIQGPQDVRVSSWASGCPHTHDTPSLPARASVSLTAITLLLLAATYSPRSAHSGISIEIPPAVKASPHLPQQRVNNPCAKHSGAHLPWVMPVPAQPWLAPRLAPRQPSAHLCSPPAKPCGHRLSPDKVRQRAATTTPSAAMPIP